MTEEVRPEVIKRTQEILGKYFKKPPLTDKLLKKPPFRFLHDIVSSVIRETGFLDGLFSDFELNSDNIKDKDAKLAYLTKLIDVVKLVTANNLNVRPSKIIAGREPTKTNELLQAIGKALDKKVSSLEAIEHYKSNGDGKSKFVSKTKTLSKEDSKKPISRQSLQSRKSVDKEKPVVDNKKRSVSTSKAVPRETKTRGEDRRDKNRDREKENKGKIGDVETRDEKVLEIPPPPAEPVEEKRTSSVRRQRNSASVKPPKEDPLSPKGSESPKIKPALLDSTNSPTHKRKDSPKADSMKSPLSKQKKSDRRPSLELKSKAPFSEENETYNKKTANSEIRMKKSAEKNEYKLVSKEPIDLLSPIVKSQKTEAFNNKLEKQATFDNPGSPPPKSIVVGTSLDETTDEKTVIIPESTTIRPRTSLRPPSARPMSARPAAPRMRSKPEFTFNEDITTPMGTVNVIVENFDTREEDDDVDDMVVMETGVNLDSPSIDGLGRTESQLSEEHGHLVAQILETQRELINTENVDVMPKKVEIEWEAGSRRDRETTIKEVDKLRSSIQTLTRATNPLGKLLDYLQEDVEMMQRELHEWQSQYNQFSEQLEREQILTQESIEPMKETLKDIEANIKIELDKICQIKASVMKNDQKIQRLLNGNL